MEGSQARFSFQDLWYVATVMQLSTAEASNGAKLGPAPNTNIEDLTIFLVFNFNRRRQNGTFEWCLLSVLASTNQEKVIQPTIVMVSNSSHIFGYVELSLNQVRPATFTLGYGGTQTFGQIRWPRHQRAMAGKVSWFVWLLHFETTSIIFCQRAAPNSQTNTQREYVIKNIYNCLAKTC